jgi:metallo-beta-lactamase class B
VVLTGCTSSFRAKIYSTVRLENCPRDPIYIADNLFYVGSSNTSSFLLDAGQGKLVLFDAGYDNTPPIIFENIRALGFDPLDIDLILNTHTHFDHAAGIKAIQTATNAELWAGEKSSNDLKQGGKNDFHILLRPFTYEPPEVTRTLQDGESVFVGDTRLTMYETPGHAEGCTSWRFDVIADGESRSVLLICGLRILPFTRFESNKNYPEIREDYIRTYSVLESIPCDILLAPHAEEFDFNRKVSAQKYKEDARPFIDRAGCAAYLKAQRKIFLDKSTSHLR